MCFKENDLMSQQGSFVLSITREGWLEWLLRQEFTMKRGFSIKMAKCFKRKKENNVTRHENTLCLEFLRIFVPKTMKKLFLDSICFLSQSNCGFMGLGRAELEATSGSQSGVISTSLLHLQLPNPELSLGVRLCSQEGL